MKKKSNYKRKCIGMYPDQWDKALYLAKLSEKPLSKYFQDLVEQEYDEFTDGWKSEGLNTQQQMKEGEDDLC